MDKPVLPILIVEDDEPTQKLLSVVLGRFGFASEIAADGSEAIARLRQHEYAIVLLDMMMPRVDGWAVVNFLVSAERQVPVIVCSAAGPNAMKELPEGVVKAVIRKPFDIDQLIVTIRSLLGDAD